MFIILKFVFKNLFKNQGTGTTLLSLKLDVIEKKNREGENVENNVKHYLNS